MSAAETRPFLSIVIPVYNEAARLGESLRRIEAFLSLKDFAWELIVADDGSTDGTPGIVREFQKSHGSLDIQVLAAAKNEGKGDAVKRGVLASRGERVLVTDADLSSPIKEADKLLAALERGSDVAIGSRARRAPGCDVQQSPKRWFAGRVFNALVKGIALGGYGDTQCGFKCFTRKAALDLFGAQTLKGFCFDVEILLLARRKGHKVSEVPVMWREASGSKVNLIRHSLAMVKELLALRKRYR